MNYSADVIDRVRSPLRVGSLPRDGADVGTGEAGTMEDGAVARIQVRVAGRRIVEARFRVFGCSAAIASASLMAEWLEGAAVGDAPGVTADGIVAALALPAERRPTAALVVTAAERALADWKRKAQR